MTKGFVELHSALSSYAYDRAVAESWKQFYELTATLHDCRNARARGARIPVFASNGHHHAARWWLTSSRGKVLGPLVHFDSHHDQWAAQRPGAILSALSQIRAGGSHRPEGLRSLRKLVDDHRTPVSVWTLGASPHELVWCHPYWSAAPEITRRLCHYAEVCPQHSSRGSYQLLHDRREDGNRALPPYPSAPWTECSSLKARQQLKHRRNIRMSYLQTEPGTTKALGSSPWKRLRRAVPRGRYLLDIDTDYFLTVDLKSGFERSRCTELTGSRTRQRSLQDDNRCLTRYEQQLEQARRLVDKRLRRFQRLLERLRDAGRLPSLVTIADSTYQPFAVSVSGEGYWEYMPYEFAAYVHWELRRMLDRVFAGRGIEAGV